VALTRGEIEAQRREGGGARFVFTLPATEQAPATEQPA
jgi:signal transduction histidine kinase